MPIVYQVGDATQPQGSGPKIISHICNDVGGWGRGFVVAVSNRWKEPESDYRRWAEGKWNTQFELGEVRFVEAEQDLWVVNMIAQHKIRSEKGLPPIRYEALEKCLKQVAEFADTHKASVHMPRIGAGLAGGSWEAISEIIDRTVIARGVAVTVYDLPI